MNGGLKRILKDRLSYSASVIPVLLACLLMSVLPAASQESETTDRSPDAQQPRITELPPAYGDQMNRLAEILGALHYLRALCGAEEGQLWRDEMQKMLEAEEPSDERRAQLVAAFNRGFRGYQEIYRTCTPPAFEAANEFLKQGMRLAAEIPNRFGG